jgi:hypothetical protein
MKPFRGVFSARPYAGEPNGDHRTGIEPAPPTEIAPGLFSPRPGPKHLLWEVLVELGFVDEQRVLEAEAVARASRQDLGAVLLERGLVTDEQLARAVAQREGVLFADLARYPVDEAAASLITPAVAERYGAVPIGFGSGGDVLLALANPRDRHAINDISMMVEPSVTRVVATRESIDELIRARKLAAYDEEAGEADDATGERPPALDGAGDENAGGAPVGDQAGAAPVNGDAPAVEAIGGENGSVASAPSAWFDLEPESDAVAAAEPHTPEEPANDAPSATDAAGESVADRELLESLGRSVGEVERLLREGVGGPAGDPEAAAVAERRLDELRSDLERERAERADAERALREQLETERAERAEAERTLREQLATERAEAERGLREELETEQATREALAAELAAVRTARDDLARRVASARDLLELGARPFVPLHGREG